MGIVDSIKTHFGRFIQLSANDCLEYHNALLTTPHSHALSMTFAQLFVTPLDTISESLSQSFAGTMRYIPIILSIVIILIQVYSLYEVHLPFMMGSL
ncbi:unnamed protein product [Rotaria sp. Silwood1]|nr:unnamed protein product [Rotaria sp. Silwood1]CAF5168472.1 unnamed protein product [Rotaria sp. Silwood1]